MKNGIIALWLPLLMILSLQGEPWNISKVGDVVTDSYIGVLGNGDVAYATSPYGLLVIDVSDRAEPRLIQRIETEGTAREMALNDTLLFLCDGYAGLKIYNVIDPQEPSLISTCSDVPGASRVKIRDDLAFIGAEGSGFYIVNISDPHDPERIGNHRRNAADIALNGDYAYTSGGYIGIFDISDPTNPEHLGNLGERIGDEIYCRDGVLFSTTRWFSLDEPDNPSLIFNRGLLGNSSGCIALNDHYYWIPGSEHDGEIRGPGLFCYDISDPSHPERVGGCEMSSAIPITGGNIDYDRGTIYLARQHYGFAVVDADDPSEPREVTVLDANPAAFTDVAAMDGWVYAVDKTGRLITYSVDNPHQPELTDEMVWNDFDIYSGEPWLLEVADEYLYELTDIAYRSEGGRRIERKGLFVYSLENPDHPDSVGGISWYGSPAVRDIVIDDGIIYMASSRDSLVAISLADPTNPQVIGRSQYQYRSYYEIDAQGNLVVTTASSMDLSMRGIVIWDKSDPTNLRRLAELDLDERVRNVVLDGGYAYLNHLTQLFIVSLEDPEEPEVVNTMNLQDTPREMKIRDERLYMTTIYHGLAIYSLEDPEHPILAGYFDTPDNSWDFDFAGDYLVVADGTDLGIYDARRAQGAWYLDISADSHDFGDTPVDSTVEWQLTVRNLSECERTLDTVEIEGDVFICPFDSAVTLGADEHVVLVVSFTPLADSIYACRLIIHSGDDVLEVSLQGRGIPPDGIKESPEVIRDFFLSVYPNPFNDQTTFLFNLPNNQTISLCIYDLSGRLVAELISGRLRAGVHTVVFDGSGLASGVYMVRFAAAGRVSRMKVALVK